jgi:hypothetical protein
MKLLMLRSWLTGPTDIEGLIQQTVASRFDGIEGPIPQDSKQRLALCQGLKNNGLVFIAEASTG